MKRTEKTDSDELVCADPFRKSTPPGMVIEPEETTVDPSLLKEAWTRNYEVQKKAIEAMRQARKDNRITRVLALSTTMINVLIALLVVVYVADVRRISIETGAKINKVSSILIMVAEAVVADNEAAIVAVEQASSVQASAKVSGSLKPIALKRRQIVVRTRLRAQKKAVAVLARLAPTPEAKESAVEQGVAIQKKVDALDDTLD